MGVIAVGFAMHDLVDAYKLVAGLRGQYNLVKVCTAIFVQGFNPLVSRTVFHPAGDFFYGLFELGYADWL